MRHSSDVMSEWKCDRKSSGRTYAENVNGDGSKDTREEEVWCICSHQRKDEVGDGKEHAENYGRPSDQNPHEPPIPPDKTTACSPRVEKFALEDIPAEKSLRVCKTGDTD